jgi:hypothetical protein
MCACNKELGRYRISTIGTAYNEKTAIMIALENIFNDNCTIIQEINKPSCDCTPVLGNIYFY